MLFHFATFVVCLTAWCSSVEGHGRLIDPPSRSSVWRYKSVDSLIQPYESIINTNYNDNQLFCGGAQTQANNNGRCGVCGDAFDATNPENVPPGPYAKGIIVRQYSEGSWIDVKVEITTHHKGYFEFRLCPWNNVTTPITHECLNENLLYITNVGSTQYDITSMTQVGTFHLDVKLPDDITCDQCVLQWRYHTGNSWGCDEDGDCDIGLGPQEEFYGCADIAIGTNPVVPPPGFREGDNVTTTSTSAGSATQSSTTTISTTSTTQSSTSTTSTTPESSNEDNVCDGNQNGYVKIDCYSYYRCVNGISYQFNCSPGTKYEETSNTCQHEDQVDCS